jgi:hypothetical protein
MQDENHPQTILKKKGIRKVTTKPEQSLPSTARTSLNKTKTPSLLTKVARKVNLRKKGLSLEEKQKIFQKVVGEVSKNASKKDRKKDRKKQRYLIKKVTILIYAVS